MKFYNRCYAKSSARLFYYALRTSDLLGGVLQHLCFAICTGRQLAERIYLPLFKCFHGSRFHSMNRALVRTGATGAWAPVNFGQRVPGTRQFSMFNLFMRLILVKLVKKFGNFSFANNCAPVN